MSEAFDPRKCATAFDQASALAVVLELERQVVASGSERAGRVASSAAPARCEGP